MGLFKSPVEKDVSSNGKLTPTQTVRALFTAQWQFYKYGYDTMLKVAALEVVIIFILLVVVFFLSMRGDPEPKYFAINAQRQLMNLEPLGVQRISDNQVRQFVTDGLLEAMNFTYDDYTQRLEKASIYFTDDGYKSWLKALDDSTLIQQMKSKQLLVRSVLVSTPEIDHAESKDYGGTFVWVINVKVKRTLTDRAVNETHTYEYKLFVKQVPFNVRPLGMGIYIVKQINDISQ